MVIPDSIFSDTRLSIADIGLLVFLIHKNPFFYSEKLLCRDLKQNGRTSIRSSISRLENFGYLSREIVRDINSKISSATWVINVPTPPNQAGSVAFNTSIKNQSHSHEIAQRETTNEKVGNKEIVENIVNQILEIEEKLDKEEEEDINLLKMKDEYNQKQYNRYRGRYINPKDQSYQLKGIWIPIEIWKDTDLNHMEMRVLVEIMNRAIDDRLVFGYEWLCKTCGCSIHHIYRIIDALAKKSYISIHPIINFSDNFGYRRYIKINKFKYLLPARYEYVSENIKKSGVKL